MDDPHSMELFSFFSLLFLGVGNYLVVFNEFNFPFIIRIDLVLSLLVFIFCSPETGCTTSGFGRKTSTRLGKYLYLFLFRFAFDVVGCCTCNGSCMAA